jgi:uracil-DNA glycosylase
MRTIADLTADVEREARRAPFPVDVDVYRQAGRGEHVPVLFAGALDAPVCILGRDLGKDEVAAGQPLIGAGGRLVRAGLYRARHHGEEPPKTDRTLESVLSYALLTNTVPYKPPGNKAYATGVKERFRPYLAELLTMHWEAKRLITLGNEAFQWFAPYEESRGDWEAFWKRADRYEAVIACTIVSNDARKILTIMPLPHPSPLNQRWYARFPGLLDQRLASCLD